MVSTEVCQKATKLERNYLVVDQKECCSQLHCLDESSAGPSAICLERELKTSECMPRASEPDLEPDTWR